MKKERQEGRKEEAGTKDGKKRWREGEMKEKGKEENVIMSSA